MRVGRCRWQLLCLRQVNGTIMRIIFVSVLLLSTLNMAITLAAPASGGGGSTTPQDNMVSSHTLPIRAAIPGQPDGAIAVVFTITQPSTSLLVKAVTLYRETQTVDLHGGWFTTVIGERSPSGVSPDLFKGRTDVRVSWALASAPTAVIDSEAVAISGYAEGFAPGAASAVTSGVPALELSNRFGAALQALTTGNSNSALTCVQSEVNGSGSGVRANSDGEGGGAVMGYATDPFGAGIGIEGRARSPSGAGGLFINTGGGDLISGLNASGQAFRVDNQGRVYQAGAQVPQYGPAGVEGPEGDRGPAGATGPPGPAGSTPSFCIAAMGGACLGRCIGGAISTAQPGPCQVNSQSGPCSFADSSGVCCVCGPI